MKRIAFILGLCALTSGAEAQQSVRQSGNVTPGHVPMWTTTGVIQDGGTAAAGFLSSLGVTNNGGPGICVNSAPITSPYNQICLSVTTNGGSKISSYANNGATTPGITFDINGTISGFPVVNLPVTAGDIACFADATGTLYDCSNTLNVRWPITTITKSTIITTSYRTVLCDATLGNVTITLPTASSSISGNEFFVKKIDSSVNTCTLAVTGGGNIDGSATYEISVPYDSVHVQTNATQWWVL